MMIEQWQSSKVDIRFFKSSSLQLLRSLGLLVVLISYPIKLITIVSLKKPKLFIASKGKISRRNNNNILRCILLVSDYQTCWSDFWRKFSWWSGQRRPGWQCSGRIRLFRCFVDPSFRCYETNSSSLLKQQSWRHNQKRLFCKRRN